MVKIPFYGTLCAIMLLSAHVANAQVSLPKPFIYRYDIDASGALSNGRIFFDATQTARTER